MRVTGSSLERAEKCPASMVLPWAQSTTEASVRGTANHANIERAIRVGNQLDLSDELWEFIKSFTNARAEVGVALDFVTKTSRYVMARGPSGYEGIGPTEVALTIDFIGERDGVTWCVDWKSRERVSVATENAQLLAGAVGCGASKVAIFYLNDDEVDCANVSDMDKDAFWMRLARLDDKIFIAANSLKAGSVDVHEGSWCNYCPAKFACPAKTSYVRQALALAPGAELTRDRAGEVWVEVQKAKKMISTMEDALKLMLNDGPIPLPNGKDLVSVEQLTKRVDMAKVEAFYASHNAVVPRKESVSNVTREKAR